MAVIGGLKDVYYPHKISTNHTLLIAWSPLLPCENRKWDVADFALKHGLCVCCASMVFVSFVHSAVSACAPSLALCAIKLSTMLFLNDARLQAETHPKQLANTQRS